MADTASAPFVAGGNGRVLLADGYGVAALGIEGRSFGSYPFEAPLILFHRHERYHYGKRAGRSRSKWLGVALMLYPYAIPQTWFLYVVGAAVGTQRRFQ